MWTAYIYLKKERLPLLYIQDLDIETIIERVSIYSALFNDLVLIELESKGCKTKYFKLVCDTPHKPVLIDKKEFVNLNNIRILTLFLGDN